ncbi:MAG: aminotransferase class V-fold PLP-dependent enzyme [Deltaproteobacteria bacterium]|nr:aminotransferase class V-fold PLP-dependent enzyme [Deltaproteobacteria bacterium]
MRDLFLLDPELVFLNHGSFGACPAEVFVAYQRWQRELERNPVEFLGRRSAALLWEARSALAAYLGTRPELLVFLPNTTHGVNTVLRSLPLAAGDEVVTTDQEYGACDAAWEHACERAGARYVHAEIPLPFRAEELAERVWSAVTPRTRALYLSHITSTTALTFPLAELIQRARAAGILTIVDGAHAPGHVTLGLDALGADFYTGNCHKWLCAPKGTAFLWARAEHHARLEALVTSWGYAPQVSGHTGFDAYTGTTLLERRHQWQGTRDLAAFLTVPDAIAFQKRHAWEGVRERCHALAAEALRQVSELTGLPPICLDRDFGQMVAIPIPKAGVDPVALKSALFDKHRVEVPITSHGEHLFVRVSIQGYNSLQDVDALAQALKEELRVR